MKLAIGIMSGTSLDGIDIVVAKIKGTSITTEIDLVACETLDFKPKLLLKIKEVIDIKTSNVQKITSLNFELGDFFAEKVLEVLEKNKINLSEIDFVASHGQTIWHQADATKDFVKSTLQIGEGSVLAERLKTTVVSNFRAADIAAYGNGAPLVSYFDKLFFSKYNKKISLHNLGGISNLTLLVNGNSISFDTGPANMMINYAMKVLFNKDYDCCGNVAKKGKIIQAMYDEVMSLDYFNKPYPKTTGRELFGDNYTQKLIDKYVKSSKEDIITTLSLITIDSIINEYKKLENEFGLIDEIVFSGGGVHNDFIISKIKEGLVKTEISKIEKYGLSSDFKEAIAFIVLGNETLNFLPGNDISSTGAKKRAILGQVNYYFEE